MDDDIRRWMRLVEAAAIPTLAFPTLYHVGSLDPKHKRRDSYEGAGLSVSIHPAEWRQIARGLVAGQTWALTKAKNKFIAATRLSKTQKAMIAQWAVTNGWAESSTIYRLSWFDDEMDDTMYSDFTTREEAEREAYDPEDADIKEIPGTLIATDALRHRTNNDAAPVTVPDLILTVYAEELGYDGVWWDDRLDVRNYSAPRGVIVPSKIKTWTVLKPTSISG